ncbi:MAG: Hsp20/alpha crystallin family protein [Candidatus Paceibacteria bacterium]
MTIKRSFFERLSGSAASDNSFDSFDDDMPIVKTSREAADSAENAALPSDDAARGSGQLPVDVHQTPNEIVIRAFVAGVRPDELNISISRDMVEIEGTRSEREQISTPDYFSRELFWGSFTRNILLPQEIDVDATTASAKDGLLTIVLPKLDKTRQTKLRVKAG